MISGKHPADKPPQHVRLPQQSEKVIGPEEKPGAIVSDPRTATQDPALKPKKKPE